MRVRRLSMLLIAIACSMSVHPVAAQRQPAPATATTSETRQAPPAAASPGARLLRVGAPVGAAFAFATTIHTQAVNADGEFRAEIFHTQRVSSRTADEVTWAVDTSTGAITSRGVFAGVEKGLSQLNGFTMTKVTDALGQTRSLTVGDRTMASTGTPDITFPDRAVAPGDSWTAEVENSGRKATIRYTFKRLESVGGRPALIMEGAYEPGQFITSVTPLVFRLDAADCMPIDVNGTMQLDMGGRVIRMTFTMNRR